MPYFIGSSEFVTKQDITKRCQEIRDQTTDGTNVSPEDFAFLISLFRHHDEWHEKAELGVEAISTQTTEHGTRGFILRRADGSQIDISFPHAIKLIPTGNNGKLTPQKLLDYKAAARTAVQDQIRDFRDLALSERLCCPINGIPLDRANCQVHYPPPDTFEGLLFNFTRERNISPLNVVVDSCGTMAKFYDVELSTAWAVYHRQYAKLKLVSKDGRQSLPKSPTDWSDVL